MFWGKAVVEGENRRVKAYALRRHYMCADVVGLTVLSDLLQRWMPLTWTLLTPLRTMRELLTQGGLHMGRLLLAMAILNPPEREMNFL